MILSRRFSPVSAKVRISSALAPRASQSVSSPRSGGASEAATAGSSSSPPRCLWRGRERVSLTSPPPRGVAWRGLPVSQPHWERTVTPVGSPFGVVASPTMASWPALQLTFRLVVFRVPSDSVSP